MNILATSYQGVGSGQVASPRNKWGRLLLFFLLALFFAPSQGAAQGEGTDSTDAPPPLRLFPVSPIPDTTGPVSIIDTTPQPELWRAGFMAGLLFNRFSASFTVLPNVPSCCPEYRNGGGVKFAFGGMFEMPLSDQFSVGGKLLYANIGGKIAAEETETVFDGAAAVTATFGHTIETNLHVIAIEPIGLYQATNRLHLFAGPQIRIGLSSAFTQEERLLSPSNIRFENNQRTRMNFDGSISEATPLAFALTGGVRYELPWRGIQDVLLAPEISGWYSLSNVADNLSWKVHGIRFGVTAMYLRRSEPPPPPPKPELKPKESLPPLPGGPRLPSGAGG